MSIALLRDMFDQMVVRKDATVIERFYDPSFEMHSNGIVRITRPSPRVTAACTPPTSPTPWSTTKTPAETADKVAGRVWITTSRPDEEPTRIEVVLIAVFTHGRIGRLWETTWPSWNALPAFEDY